MCNVFLTAAFYIEGGMSQLVRGLVESSGADLNLNSRVTHIIRKTQEDASQQYTVKYVTDGVDHEIDADAVVIAAPLEWAGKSIFPKIQLHCKTSGMQHWVISFH